MSEKLPLPLDSVPAPVRDRVQKVLEKYQYLANPSSASSTKLEKHYEALKSLWDSLACAQRTEDLQQRKTSLQAKKQTWSASIEQHLRKRNMRRTENLASWSETLRLSLMQLTEPLENDELKLSAEWGDALTLRCTSLASLQRQFMRSRDELTALLAKWKATLTSLREDYARKSQASTAPPPTVNGLPASFETWSEKVQELGARRKALRQRNADLQTQWTDLENRSERLKKRVLSETSTPGHSRGYAPPKPVATTPWSLYSVALRRILRDTVDCMIDCASLKSILLIEKTLTEDAYPEIDVSWATYPRNWRP